MSAQLNNPGFVRLIRLLFGRRFAYLCWASWRRITVGKAERGTGINRYRSRQELILVPRLMALLPEGERVRIIDGGAREMDKDFRWHAFPADRLEFHGFEPDQAEAKRLDGMVTERGSSTRLYPAGLWGYMGSVEFEHNNIGGGSSFLRQNRVVTDRWKFENPSQTTLSRDIFFPKRYESMPVVSLADWAVEAKVRQIDFMKLNVQGGELEILQGAGELLNGTLGVLAEVAFVESYKDRPMFSDIDVFMRSRGFCFFDLLAHHYIGRTESPVAAVHLALVEPKLGQLVSSWGQLIEGHAIYFRDPIGSPQPKHLDGKQMIKLVALAEAFGQIEYAFELMEWMAKQPDIADTDTAERLRVIIDEAAKAYSAYD